MLRRRTARRVPTPTADSRAAVVGLVALAAVVAGCTSPGDPAPRPTPTPSTTAAKTELTFGVFGSPAEVEAFEPVVASYNASAVSTRVELVSWPDRDAMRADLDAGGDVPDLFMVARRDLPAVIEGDVNAPLFELLDERGINYGDRYRRDALEAFSADNQLQCVPFSSSPMVMYYNTDLIDFDKMAARGLPVPDPEDPTQWTFEMFAAAAQFASRPRRDTKGVSIAPTLQSLAPFVYAGGGNLFDDESAPTSLAFGDDDNVESLAETLELLRDPQVTLTNRQLARTSPLEAFEAGALGMIEGFRSLTPRLRAVEDLDFDVIAMPEIDEAATIGDFTGLCISRGPAVGKTADFLVHVLSEDSLSAIARTGYIVPADQAVARSPEGAFLQPFLEPAHAAVFNASIDDMRVTPLIDDSEQLNQTVGPLLAELLTRPVLGPDELEELTAEIDEASRSVLDPDYEPSEGPSVGPPGGPSGSPSGSPSRGPSGSPSTPGAPGTPSGSVSPGS